MKIIVTTEIKCENLKEYNQAYTEVNDEYEDMDALNEMCNDDSEMEIIEDKDNLTIKVITRHNR